MKTALLVLVGLVVAFLAFGFSVSSSPEGQAKSRARQAISYCWSDHGKRSLEPDAARLLAGTCEKMEADFEAKYGSKP